jgi:hypothetical protein
MYLEAGTPMPDHDLAFSGEPAVPGLCGCLKYSAGSSTEPTFWIDLPPQPTGAGCGASCVRHF